MLTDRGLNMIKRITALGVACLMMGATTVYATPTAGHTAYIEGVLKTAGAEKENVIEGKIEAIDTVIEYSDSELELFTRVVEAEAGGCQAITKTLVADTIINRVKDADFPASLYGVLTQTGQYVSVADGGIYRHTPTDETIAICKRELSKISYQSVIYFRESYYFSWGTPWSNYDNLYFSLK